MKGYDLPKPSSLPKAAPLLREFYNIRALDSDNSIIIFWGWNNYIPDPENKPEKKKSEKNSLAFSY